MYESVERYRDELPPQCIDCPLFQPGAELVEAAEGTGNLTRASGYETPAEYPLGFYGNFPDMRPGAENGRSREAQRALSALGELASAAGVCPGPRGGGGMGYGLRARAAALFGGQRVCRNPRATDIMQNYPER